jgi:hypothetical protein
MWRLCDCRCQTLKRREFRGWFRCQPEISVALNSRLGVLVKPARNAVKRRCQCSTVAQNSNWAFSHCSFCATWQLGCHVPLTLRGVLPTNVSLDWASAHHRLASHIVVRELTLPPSPRGLKLHRNCPPFFAHKPPQRTKFFLIGFRYR